MRILIFIVVLISYSSCGIKSKSRLTSKEALRSEAKEFIFSILKNYFNDDCQASHKLFSDSVILLSQASIFPKPANISNYCQAHANIVMDKSKTLEDYFNTYNYIIKDYDEIIRSIGNESTVKKYLKQGDFLFNGIRRKPEFYNKKDFIMTNAFMILVRKENGEWRFKGMAGG